MITEVPSAQAGDAEILAAVQSLVPVRSGEVVLLLPRRKVIDLIEERREDGGEVSDLLAALEFDGEGAFRNAFSRLATARVTVRTSTMYLLLGRMASTGEPMDAVVRHLLAPSVEEAIDRVAEHGDKERTKLLRLSLQDWVEERGDGDEDLDVDIAPILRISEGTEELTPDLRKYSRYFLKNLFRLNNVHGANEFYHLPEVIEDYWEVVAPDQGVFDAEIAPLARSLTVGMFRTSRAFGLARTENPDYFDLVEMLTTERRSPRIKGCQVEVHGATPEDQVALEEALSIESLMVEDPTSAGQVASLPKAMSPEGLESFRSRLRGLSGIRANVRFPVNVSDPEMGDQDFSVLGFDLEYDKEAKRFLLDGEMVSPATLHLIVLAVGGKLLALSRQLYREPASFPSPEMDKLEAEVHALIARAEERELTEELAREIVAKITVLDYYESLAKYSYALSERIADLLDSTQEIEFTMPRALVALLNVALRERDADQRMVDGLEGR